MKLKSFSLSAAFSTLLAGSVLSAGAINSTNRMILDLGEGSPYVKVTREYTRDSVDAVLPYISDVVQKLQLPIKTPITDDDILRGRALPFKDVAVSVMLKSGWAFTFQNGIVHQISNSKAYSSLQDPSHLEDYFGQVKMSPEEAVALARDDLQKLDIPLKAVYADQDAVITPPKKIGTNTIPVYEIQWLDPRNGRCVDIHINAEKRQIERLVVISKALRLFTPVLKEKPETDPFWPSVNPEYARQLVPMMFRAIDEYARKLSLPVALPLTTNNVYRIQITDNEGWPHAEVTLTNGWRFIYRHTMVNGYYSPDVFFSDKPEVDIDAMKGNWKLNDDDAIQLVKKTLAKLDFPTNNIHTDFKPFLIYPQGEFKNSIPRVLVQWLYKDNDQGDLKSKVEAEVNAASGKVESLYYDDTTYWNSRPAITVPISTTNHYPNYEKQFQQN